MDPVGEAAERGARVAMGLAVGRELGARPVARMLGALVCQAAVEAQVQQQQSPAGAGSQDGHRVAAGQKPGQIPGHTRMLGGSREGGAGLAARTLGGVQSLTS